MPLSRPPSRSDSDWPDEILEEAREEFDGELVIREPGTHGERDPITGAYAPFILGAVVLTARPARAQHIRLPLDSNDGNGSQARRRYRFQCEILPGDAAVTQGLVAYFTGGRDPELAKMTFQVRMATNSSHAALRTIETITEAARV
jgi:hypothetical protein